MDPTQRIVTKLPIAELWNEHGIVAAIRQRRLDAAGIRNLLRRTSVHFAVANCGAPLRWIPPSESFSFWKHEVGPHLPEASAPRLDNFAGGYCYFASEWITADGGSVIVLEMAH
jgi:hypothetical protein